MLAYQVFLEKRPFNVSLYSVYGSTGLAVAT